MVHSHVLRRSAVLVALIGGVAAPMPPAAMADVCAYVASVAANQIAVARRHRRDSGLRRGA